MVMFKRRRAQPRAPIGSCSSSSHVTAAVRSAILVIQSGERFGRVWVHVLNIGLLQKKQQIQGNCTQIIANRQ